MSNYKVTSNTNTNDNDDDRCAHRIMISCNGHRPAGSVEPLLFPGRPWRRQWGRCAKPTLRKI